MPAKHSPLQNPKIATKGLRGGSLTVRVSGFEAGALGGTAGPGAMPEPPSSSSTSASHFLIHVRNGSGLSAIPIPVTNAALAVSYSSSQKQAMPYMTINAKQAQAKAYGTLKTGRPFASRPCKDWHWPQWLCWHQPRHSRSPLDRYLPATQSGHVSFDQQLYATYTR
eukprot:scaffold133070_cov36-Prasinocladus_malaysianus.AAC.1